ncbi:MAG: copper amine oxidase N-terminal domain-containing protein [Clostridia bacterium]|nr:copper amine oxidase N-terminal domain-containing protein [Clostridia bacterium]
MFNKKSKNMFLMGAIAAITAATTMTAYAEPAEVTINAYFNNYNIIINGTDKSKTPEDSRPFIYNERTYVPLRYIGESLGKEVIWDGDTSTIYINDQDTDDENTNSESYESTDTNQQMDDALEQYRSIVGQADTYQYDPYGYATPSGKYRYALIRMQSDDTVPTLFLEQESTDGMYYMRAFKYDINTKEIHQPAEGLTEGVGQVGGFRGGIGIAGDGNGLIIMEGGSRGYATFYRVTLDGDTLEKNVEWDGNMFQSDPGISTTEIDWHDISDLSAFSDWSVNGEKSINVYFDNYNIIINGEDKSDAPEDSKPFIYNSRTYIPLRYISELLGKDVNWDGETSTIYINESDISNDEMPEQAETDTVNEPITDGERIVLTGTVGAYSFDEVLALQGVTYPNPDPGSEKYKTFYLIVLDTPQTVTANNADGELDSRTAKIIDVSYADDMVQYVGQHITFSIDPHMTGWPSDTSLPLGEPSTRDIHILN